MMLYEKLFKTVVLLIYMYIVVFSFPSECNCLGIQNNFIWLSAGVSRSFAILRLLRMSNFACFYAQK